MGVGLGPVGVGLGLVGVGVGVFGSAGGTPMLWPPSGAGCPGVGTRPFGRTVVDTGPGSTVPPGPLFPLWSTPSDLPLAQPAVSARAARQATARASGRRWSRRRRVAFTSSRYPPGPVVTPAGDGDETVRVTAWVRGTVQGVGFRWWVRSQALELGLAGHAANLEDGRVEVVAQGPARAVAQLLERLGGAGVPGRPGRVTGITQRTAAARGGLSGFVER